MEATDSAPADFFDALPEDRKEAMLHLRKLMNDHLPKGFEETVSGGMINYIVPHSLFPAGYHCNPKQPLPFISIALQKNFIAVYHMGLYSHPDLLQWFTTEYAKHSKTKLDMGKSCIRFKNPANIPYALLGQLAEKMTPRQWITIYENALKR